MSAPDTVAVLGQHADWVWVVAEDGGSYACIGCGHRIGLWTPEEDFRSHLAAVLDAHYADRERAAAEKAWDEGWYDRMAGKSCVEADPPNPYYTDKEADQ